MRRRHSQGLHRSTRARLVAAILAIGVSIASFVCMRAARADGFDAERFEPAAGAAGGFVVERPIVPRHLGWGLGAFVNYARRPVVIDDHDSHDVLAAPLDSAVGADVLGSIGLGNFFELAAHVPIRPIWKGDDVVANGQPLRARAGIGDLRVVPKFQIVDTGSDSFHFTLGAAIPVTFPTGNGTALRGSQSVSVEPRVLFAIGGNKWDWYFSLGYLARPAADTNLAGKKEYTFGTAFSLGLADWVDLDAEVWGANVPDAQTDGNKTPIEGLLGAIFWPTKHWSIYVGGGPGITHGLGSPDYRFVLGVRVGDKIPGRNRFRDRDGDGIDNDLDKCPDQPEDKDGFEDDDGCPEPDNDHDGILDDDDECPNVPEEIGGDADGCPDKAKIIIEGNEIVVIGKVQFESGSAKVMKKSQPFVDEIAKVMKDHPDMRVRIEGHTDDTGPIEFNDKLSKDRAESVKSELVARGIAANRLETEGYGPRQPLAPNETPAGRARNRRVEFKIIE